jgi:hypothetical protein
MLRDVSTFWPTLQNPSRLRPLLLAVSVLFASLALAALPGKTAQAADAMRLKENFLVIGLTPYTQKLANDDLAFSLQNGSNQPLDLVLQRAGTSRLVRALGLAPSEEPPLRLFASDDSEFIASPETPHIIKLQIPAASLQTFLLIGATDERPLYLWSPSHFMAFENRLQAVQLTLVSTLLLMVGVATFMVAYRRSRRGVHAVVMAMGLLVLLVSLRGEEMARNSGLDLDFLPNSDLTIRMALAFGLVMIALGHLNLVMRRVINRNYWTRVIIFADICLAISIGLFVTAMLSPDFAGVLSFEMPHMALGLTTACILLGVIFLPDRRDHEPG